MSQKRRWDPLSAAERSERMSRVRGRDTKPEIIVRRLVHGMGFRYRLRAVDLPGKPDLVFRPQRKVIFVHGCFWHLHGCNRYRLPKTRTDFWLPKLPGNSVRDKRTKRKLWAMGWRVLTVWECQLRDTNKLATKIEKFLS